MAGKPLQKAQQVRTVVDAFYRAFIEARDACLGSPRVHRDKTKERHDAGFDTAVIGFWQKNEDIPRIVCSLAGMSMIGEICQKRQKLQDTVFASSKRRKAFNEMWDRFEGEVLRRIPQVCMTKIGVRLIFKQDPHIDNVRRDLTALEKAIVDRVQALRANKELLSPQPGDRISEQIAKDLRDQPRTFNISEAEAFMASSLMRSKTVGVVHWYGRWSPCCTCSPSLKWLSYLYGPHAPKQQPLPSNLQWRFGWVFYGEIYEHKQEVQQECQNQLNWAKELGGIQGAELLPL